MGDFRSEAECEVLPVSHLVFVHGADSFNNLKPNTPGGKTLISHTVKYMFVYLNPPNTLMYLMTYLPRRDRFTHEDFVVGRELRRVVIHVFNFDVDAHFGVLVVTPCTHTHTHTHTQSRAKNDECSAAYKKIQSSVKFIIDQMSFVACL